MAKEHGTIHHLIPRSKGGPNEQWNKERKPAKEHKAFHILFYNLLPCQAVDEIRTYWATKSGKLKKKKLTKKSKRKHKYTKMDHWKILFGNASPKKAIEIIKDKWSVKGDLNFKGCFNYKECFSGCSCGKSKKSCPILKLYKKGELKWKTRKTI